MTRLRKYVTGGWSRSDAGRDGGPRENHSGPASDGWLPLRDIISVRNLAAVKGEEVADAE
jgi:hypothetical protein